MNVYTKNEQLILANHGAAEVLRRLVLSLYNGYAHPMPTSCISLLDRDHYSIFNEILSEYHQHGETLELRTLAQKISDAFPESFTSMTMKIADLRQAIGFYDLCQEEQDAGKTGARRDAREWVMSAARKVAGMEVSE
ncbi:hypothetical protein PL75_10040 [Neisseria arctica]|uniref:Uncharacterized protein n=1 Tax=Neisseria arctica TaxID=1470200 RepID=A0A0J0YPK3_9NEIS|nr:hypothetical protein [Neisseria arctica]KLT72076.1 hypothetical protein PL75_10040 [Neisseria arctica]UOO85680.1 hypothetical protein LVJ86_05410 [Neisseria arctica]